MIENLVSLFYDQLWNHWNDELVESVLAPDFRFRGSLGDVVTGPDGWRGYRDTIRRAAPDFHNEVVDLVVADRRAAARLRYTGHNTGGLAGHAPSGRPFEYAGAAFFESAGDRLVEAWVLGDLDGLHRQLGAP